MTATDETDSGQSGSDGDASLLERFATAGDPGALEAVARRYGPMVYAVCRRTIPDRDLADDAYQATFLILTARPPVVRTPPEFAGWLYRVAAREALRVRAAHAKRPKSLPTVEATVPEAGGLDPDEVVAVHEEVGRLPTIYRDAVIQCFLMGRTYHEAAAELRVPVGTVATRVAAAKDKLRERLLARGVTGGAAAIPAVLAPIPVPAGLATLPTGAAAGAAGWWTTSAWAAVVAGAVAAVALAVAPGKSPERAAPAPPPAESGSAVPRPTVAVSFGNGVTGEYDAAARTLVINASAANDYIVVSKNFDANTLTVETRVPMNGGGGAATVTNTAIPLGRDLSITVNGNDGNDFLKVEDGSAANTAIDRQSQTGRRLEDTDYKVATLNGGNGNDSLSGGKGLTHLFGGPGNDSLTAASSWDTVKGAARGPAGQYPGLGGTLDGGAGDDVLKFNLGSKRVVGGAGSDTFVPSRTNGTVPMTQFLAAGIVNDFTKGQDRYFKSEVDRGMYQLGKGGNPE